nr:type VII secretion protein EccC [Kibdelosporangium sp. MJ126-NF4]CEL16315.1 FtsK/SpoIIIE family protein, putative EssC component of Type VII secretion system [Kibdelosporangium sp. MJ126-NF4]CTQ94239.1 FtsK/SpoIIIE family protein, putative EssC component of Type VII secretion system [Kibdelosporangium sp. MJ126-NF4]
MSTTLFRRPSRRKPPAMPEGQLDLQEPPSIPEPQPAGAAMLLMYLPMAVSSGAMVLLFANPSSGGLAYLAGGMIAVSTIAMMVGQLAQSSSQRKHRMRGERRDYLRYLGQLRKQVRRMIGQQREALGWNHPDPQALWPIALSARLWERRPTHPDFAEVRLGVGQQRFAVRIAPPQTKPVEDLEPLSAGALRRFIRAYRNISRAPIGAYLPGFSRVQLRGDEEMIHGLVRAILAQLATLHAPGELQIAVCAAQSRLPHWDWVKWLPHAQHPDANDATGQVRLVCSDIGTLERLLGGEEFAGRPRFEPNATVSGSYVVVLLDGVTVPAGHRFTGGGYAGCVIVDVAECLPWKGGRHVLRLHAEDGRLRTVRFDRTGKEISDPLCVADSLSPARTDAVARTLAPLRMGSSVDAGDSLSSDFDLTTLLGINDARDFDPQLAWKKHSPWARLRVPVGVAEDGSPVELDIKESAEDGMGPHGMVIGATGSGKSELLRTLVIALAATHSSESLNFVLTDFKGGATFLGLDRLPHTSAVITNLEDELELVDRMQDALTGELMRRQELLRTAGNYSSVRDYEKARRGGTRLDPIPTLFVVVDEFSELLTSKPDFVETFAMIGRLGRSLAVHLLLASQRLDAGRIHLIESHLSYRIGLRTFSVMDSRAVIGVGDAYELPSSPGNGYLRSDTQTLTRFKAAYVSGTYRARRDRVSKQQIESQLVAFGTEYVAPAVRTIAANPMQEEDPPTNESLLEIMIGKLEGSGPAAHRVWLPPLETPPTLDELLPPMRPDETFGYGVADQLPADFLRVPVGVVDLPAQQRRDLLIADLSGARGHVGIVGGTRSGKSTLLRTLICSLALTHSARQVQFYCLDFGGGGLGALTGLPHVGSVATRLNRDLVTRTVSEMLVLLAQREHRFGELGIDSMDTYRQLRAAGRVDDPHGDVFLVIDGWFTLHQEFEDLENAIAEIASRGLSYGLHLVIANARWMEMRPWLRDFLGSRFELRLGDPTDSEINARAAKGVPHERPGRGITTDQQHFLTGLPRIDGVGAPDSLAGGVADLVAAVAEANVPAATPVRLLPPRLPVADLPEAEGDLRVPMGWDEARLSTLWLDFRTSPHLMVFGDTESGKSNFLRLILAAITARFGQDEAKIVVADTRRELPEQVPPEYLVGSAVSSQALAELVGAIDATIRPRLPGSDVGPEQLRKRDWWSGTRLYFLVDDYELLAGGGSPLEPLLDLLPLGAEIGFHMIVTRSTSSASRAMFDPAFRGLWDLSCPALLFSCPKDEGAFLGDVKPRQLPTGRAQYIDRRRKVTVVQTAHVD